MGKIQVGQKSPKTIDMGVFTVLSNDVSGGAPAKPQPTENKNGMTAEEKEKQEVAETATNLNGETDERSAVEQEQGEKDGAIGTLETPPDESDGTFVVDDADGTEAPESGDASAESEKKKVGRPKNSDS